MPGDDAFLADLSTLLVRDIFVAARLSAAQGPYALLALGPAPNTYSVTLAISPEALRRILDSGALALTELEERVL